MRSSMVMTMSGAMVWMGILSGCPSQPTYSCAAPDGRRCLELLTPTDGPSASVFCSTILGAPVRQDEVCPSEGRLARCTVSCDGLLLRFSAYPPHTAEELMTDCEGFGPDCNVELERF